MRRASHLGGVAQMGVHLDGRRMNQESTVTSSGIAPGRDCGLLIHPSPISHVLGDRPWPPEEVSSPAWLS